VRANVPDHVAVSVKHRLGVDECDSWEELVTLVRVRVRVRG
jgi:tRNA-dihydrouridine synthase